MRCLDCGEDSDVFGHLGGKTVPFGNTLHVEVDQPLVLDHVVLARVLASTIFICENLVGAHQSASAERQRVASTESCSRGKMRGESPYVSRVLWISTD